MDKKPVVNYLIPNPHCFSSGGVSKKLEKKLQRLQCKVSRKYEMNKQGKEYVKTGNIIKIERQIKLLHRRLANMSEPVIYIR